MRDRLRTFLADRRGVTAVEYGLIAALIGLAILGGLTAFSDAFRQLILDITSHL